MKKIMFLTLVLVSAFCFNAFAASVSVVEVHNKICPISHEEVGEHGMAPHQVTYNGKVYNLCCAMCEKDFNKDPEKYTKMMEEEAASEEKKM